ncbi:hypothetical protein JCM10212_002720 [Sporobolomyces blumeae]
MTAVSRSPASPTTSVAFSRDSPSPPRLARPTTLGRRPSAMKSPQSDQITPAVTRFDPRAVDIPPSPTFPPSADPGPGSPDRERDHDHDRSHPRASAVDRPPPLAPRAKTAPAPLLARSASARSSHKASTTSPPAPSGPSLLARRRSSCKSQQRPDLFPKLDDLKLPALPTPPLEHLDDTVRPEVVGVSSQAHTPFAASPTSDDHVVEEGYRPTRTFVATPFPTTRRKSFFEDSDDERAGGKARGGRSGDDDDEDEEDDDDETSTAESSVLDEATDGVRRYSLTDGEAKDA